MKDIPKEAWAQLDSYPLTQPPPGVIPDFVHPQWHGQPVVIVGAVGISVMLVMASIRMYSKCYLTRKWVFDDYVYLLSLRSLVLQVASPFLIWLIKLAVYSLILYAFHPVDYIRWLVYIGIVLSFCYYLAAAIVNGVICGPRGGTDRLAYLAGMAGPECGNPSGLIQIFSIASGVVNLTNDFYLLIIPLPAILKLKLPARRKFGVLVIFLAGTGACVMSILGLIYRKRGYSHDTSTTWKHDTTYLQIPLITVTTVEYTVGVIIPCMAPLGKFSEHISVNVRSYLSTRSFHRTSSLEEEHKFETPGKRGLLNSQPYSQTDTIDRMLAQMFPNKSGDDLPQSREEHDK
ncbi:hypothetical protein K469DRAFT_673989 [Zopfia rhizophila CBS 207.26]|uniref:Rhodopsin domain-containing protein n=1 Tax=Zopfia rhizophila CBS 207.26 TaxID=1314779 RepID=A0A6A6DN10_9PEZI|nr:hypothetical protein K469DRAFT_673989 [Zopfia rhizophila CBS 207.26]